MSEMHYDLFGLLEPIFKFSERLYDPEQYLKLDERLFGLLNYPEMLVDREYAPCVAKALKLYNRIRNRDIYKVVGEVLISSEEELARVQSSSVIRDIISCAAIPGILHEEDVVVRSTSCFSHHNLFRCEKKLRHGRG